MNSQQTDLTFFTNNHNQTLLDRFKTTLSDTQLFDVLVGYFRSSGFYQLYDSIEPVEKTRILVGLVYELKVAGKELLCHLGELTPLTNKAREGEKLAIIQSEFDRLYDPRHPVRNIIETLDSVEVVRTIREVLKR